MKQRGGGSYDIYTRKNNRFRGGRKTIPIQSFIIQTVGDPQSPQHNLRQSKQNSDEVAQISHDPYPTPSIQVIWNENLQVDVFLKRIVKHNLEKDTNPKMRKIHTLVKNVFFWGVMDIETNTNPLEKSVQWKSTDIGYCKQLTMKPSSLVSNIEDIQMGSGLFAGRTFENYQIVVICIGEPCGENEVSNYEITK